MKKPTSFSDLTNGQLMTALAFAEKLVIRLRLEYGNEPNCKNYAYFEAERDGLEMLREEMANRDRRELDAITTADIMKAMGVDFKIINQIIYINE